MYMILAAAVLQVSNANIALNKPTASSSVYVHSLDSHHSNAVDGNTDPNWHHGSCSLTELDDMTPFWMVDLLDDFIIHNVTITNRADDVPERLHDFRIEVFTTNPVRCPGAVGQLCKQYDGMFGSVETLTCESGVLGRFLRINKFAMINGYDLLTICEVEVQGKKQVEGCDRHSYPRITDAMYSGTSVGGEELASPSHCAQACLINGACVGFNYQKSTGNCGMISEATTSGDKVTDPSYDYYGHDFC